MKTDFRTHDEQVLIGASWYPEMWPESEWPRDIARMNELGFNIVRLFEFAWHRFEPRQDQYDMGWALKVLDQCHRAGIRVMVGTPTAAPPAWMTSSYPEVLQVDPEGRRETHGRRKHYSHINPRYREFCRRIVGRMAEAFAGHPAVHSWQIDNEMGGRDFSESARQAFHAWLKNRYGSIDALNRVWGLEFWSQAYNDFSQIPMPTSGVGSIEVPERHNPSLIIAIARFNSEMWTSFIDEQCQVIRAKSDKPITTNMAGSGLGMNWYRHNAVLDRVGYSLYKDVLHYPWNLMFLDRMRAEKNSPYWLLETAPNWSGGGKQWNIHHDDRGVQAMSWLCTALGGSMMLFWQWRSHWAGQEMQHGTCVTATGQWAPNKAAWTTLAKQFSTHGKWLLDHPAKRGDVALMMSPEAAWAFSIDPIDENMRYEVRWRDDYHLPLCQSHLWRDVIGEDADLSPYKVLLMPLMPMVPENLRKRLRDWVMAGGRLLLGPLTGYRTSEFTSFTDREFGGLEELIGAGSSIRFTVHWVEDKVDVVLADGQVVHSRNWCEGLRPTTGKAMASYRHGYGDGHAAMIDHRLGKGRVIFAGCQLPTATYLGLVRELMGEAGLAPVAHGSGDVVVAPRAGADGKVAGYGVVNLVEEPRRITLPAGGTDLLSGAKVGPDLDLAPMQAMIVRL